MIVPGFAAHVDSYLALAVRSSCVVAFLVDYLTALVFDFGAYVAALDSQDFAYVSAER